MTSDVNLSSSGAQSVLPETSGSSSESFARHLTGRRSTGRRTRDRNLRRSRELSFQEFYDEPAQTRGGKFRIKVIY